MTDIRVPKKVVNAPYWELGEHFLRFDEEQSLTPGQIEQLIDSMRVETIDSFGPDKPLYVAHRNQAQIYPDNSLGALRGSAANPYVGALEVDVRKLSDGALINMHDATVDRLCTTTGSVEAMTLAQYRALIMDPQTWHRSDVPYGARLVTFDDVLKEFGNKRILFPEVKTSGTGQDVVDALIAAGISKKMVVVSSFNLPDLLPALAAGFQVRLAVASGTSQIPAAQSAGVQWVGLGDNPSSDDDMNAWLAAGFKLAPYTINRRHRRKHLNSLGVWAFYTDDAEHIAREETSIRLKDPFKSGTWAPGMLAAGEELGVTERGKFLPDGSWGWDQVDTDISPFPRRYVLQGWAGKLSASTVTVYARLSLTELSAEARWGSFFIGDDAFEDREFRNDGTDDANGYLFAWEATGRIWISRQDNGVSTNLGNLPTPDRIPQAKESEFLVRARITPTTVAVAFMNPDGGGVLREMVYSDNTYRGGYLHLGRRNAAVKFRNVEIFYDNTSLPSFDNAYPEVTTGDHYRCARHADGAMELWIESGPLTTTQASGNIYRSDLDFVDFPYRFSGKVFATAGFRYEGGTAAWGDLSSGPTDNAAGVYVRLFCPVSTGQGRVMVHAKGRWK